MPSLEIKNHSRNDHRKFDPSDENSSLSKKLVPLIPWISEVLIFWYSKMRIIRPRKGGNRLTEKIYTAPVDASPRSISSTTLALFSAAKSSPSRYSPEASPPASSEIERITAKGRRFNLATWAPQGGFVKKLGAVKPGSRRIENSEPRTKHTLCATKKKQLWPLCPLRLRCRPLPRGG